MRKYILTSLFSALSACTLSSCGSSGDGPVDPYNDKFLFGCTTGGIVNFYNGDQKVASYAYNAAIIHYTNLTSSCRATPSTANADGILETNIHPVQILETIARDVHSITITPGDDASNQPQTQFSVTYTGSPANRGPFAPDTITGTLPGNVTFTHIESIPNR